MIMTEPTTLTAPVASSLRLDETPGVVGHQGTESLLALSAELRATAPLVKDMIDVRHGSRLMERAADALERLAHLEPDVEVIPAEN